MNKFSLEKLQVDALNEIQSKAATTVAASRDLILTAPTGSGKTLAFLLPLLQKLDANQENIQALIVVPSRELALQIEQVFKNLSTDFKINSCYGGHSVRTENNNFSNPPAVLIGTPGRLAFHFERRTIDPSFIKTLVLDEFDKSLEFGFEEDMAYIVRRLVNLKQHILTSATKISRLPKFLELKNAETIDFSDREKFEPKLDFYKVTYSNVHKDDVLLRLLASKPNETSLIFCNERETIYDLSDFLFSKNVGHEIFHGKMDQMEREKSLLKFKNGTVNMLITTDLAARGLDIPEIKNIIHYQMPYTAETFTHRNGRTARMQAGGCVFSFISQGANYEYLPLEMEEFIVKDNLQKIAATQWQTIYLSLGKKDKINKVDVVGLFLQKGGLEKTDLGLIEVKDKACYIAVKREKINGLMRLLQTAKIKGKSFKLELAS